jgi:hypothetical protein
MVKMLEQVTLILTPVFLDTPPTYSNILQQELDGLLCEMNSAIISTVGPKEIAYNMPIVQRSDRIELGWLEIKHL